MGAVCASSRSQEDRDVQETSLDAGDSSEDERRPGNFKSWKNVESGIGPRALGLQPRKDPILRKKQTEDDLMSYDATDVEEERNNQKKRDPTSLRGASDSADGSDEETEEVGNVLYSSTCMVENYMSDWTVQMTYFLNSNSRRLTLTSAEETHKNFPEAIQLADVMECTVDQTKVTVRFPKSRLVLFFEDTDRSQDFIQQFPTHLTCRLLFSEVAIYCKRQKKALVQLVTYGKQKRFVGKRHGAALLIKTEKEEVVHPIHSSTECSSQVRLVAVDEHCDDPRLLQFVTVGMAQTFIRKFSEIIHDLYAVNHILLYSGIVIHDRKTKRIELRQFDNGNTVMSIFLRKEPTITFTELPTYTRKGLELILTDPQTFTEYFLHFRTEGEVKVFTEYLSPGLE